MEECEAASSLEFVLHQYLFPIQLDGVSILIVHDSFAIFVFNLFPPFSWMLQFYPGYRENIVCRRDGTLRNSEPCAGESLACIVPFMLIYYFLMAANVWFVIFTYAWYLQTIDRGEDSKRFYAIFPYNFIF